MIDNPSFPEREMFCTGDKPAEDKNAEQGDSKKLPYGFKYEPERGLKIFIPVSHNGGGEGKTGWAIALATSFNGRNVHIMEMGGSHADRACNNMANAFLKTDCDVMLIIDIDTIFRECDIARVMAHMERGVKAVWGLYPKKSDDAPPCVNTWPEVPPADQYGLVNVRRAGRGFLCVARDVFERLKDENEGEAQPFCNHGEKEWAFFHSGVVFGRWSAMPDWEAEWISEDWMFCEDLRELLGIPTLVDTSIVLKHVGEKTYSFPADSLTRMDSKIDSWKDIHGWFDYEEFYRWLVNELPAHGSFVEVGCWMGKSLAAFWDFAEKDRKHLFVTAVDTFQGRPENPEHAAILEAHGGNVGKMFRANMKALRVNPNVVERDSVEAASAWPDESVDAVFIDAAHDKESVVNDIGAWLPKVKPGGIISGHDYDEAGVSQAVAQYFGGDEVKTMGRCWYVRV